MKTAHTVIISIDSMAKPFDKVLKLEELKPNVAKALDHLLACDDYTTQESTEAYKVRH